MSQKTKKQMVPIISLYIASIPLTDKQECEYVLQVLDIIYNVFKVKDIVFNIKTILHSSRHYKTKHMDILPFMNIMYREINDEYNECFFTTLLIHCKNNLNRSYKIICDGIVEFIVADINFVNLFLGITNCIKYNQRKIILTTTYINTILHNEIQMRDNMVMCLNCILSRHN